MQAARRWARRIRHGMVPLECTSNDVGLDTQRRQICGAAKEGEFAPPELPSERELRNRQIGEITDGGVLVRIRLRADLYEPSRSSDSSKLSNARNACGRIVNSRLCSRREKANLIAKSIVGSPRNQIISSDVSLVIANSYERHPDCYTRFQFVKFSS